MPPPALKKNNDMKEDLSVTESVSRYKECVFKSARTFAKSKETAPIVAKASIANCPTARQQVVATYKASLNRSSREGRLFILNIDKRVQSLAELEVVRLRSK